MIKLIVLCAIITSSIARSLNDNLPNALINKGDIETDSDTSNLAEPKAVAVDELAKNDREAESDTSNITEAKAVAVEKLAKNDREAESNTSNLTEPEAVAVEELAKNNSEAETDTSNITQEKAVAVEKLAKNDREAESNTSNLTEPEAVAVEELAKNNREAESDTSNLTDPKAVAVEESANDDREAESDTDDFIILPEIPVNYGKEAESDKVVGGEQSLNESDSAAVFESNSTNITDDDQKRWLFKSTRIGAGTTTPLPFTSIISLLLVVDSTAIGGG